MAGMKALLLCAGVGSRLRPLTDVLPKCLMPINGRPLLGYWLRMLCDAGVSEVLVNLHHHSSLVREYVRGSPFAKNVTFAEEPELLGTGGTLLENKLFFQGAPVLMAHADNLTVFDARQFLLRHNQRPPRAVMTMMTFITTMPGSSGIVQMDDGGIITAFHEKKENPPGNIANAAVYLIEPPVVRFLESLGARVIDFSTQVIPHFMGKIFTFYNGDYHRDIGVLESLAQAQLEYPLLTSRKGDLAEDPWYGILDRDDRRLAREFVSSIDKAFRKDP